MTAAEVLRPQGEWCKDTAGLITKARRTVIEEDKAALHVAIANRDSMQIYKYCYARAMRKDMELRMMNLSVFGIHREHMTQERCGEILVNIARWSARIMRWWEIEQ